MQQCQLNFHFILAPGFDPNEWCLKNGLLSGILNPRPLSHESSALITRPRLLAIIQALTKNIPTLNNLIYSFKPWLALLQFSVSSPNFVFLFESLEPSSFQRNIC
jgi:hypothetical protein